MKSTRVLKYVVHEEKSLNEADDSGGIQSEENGGFEIKVGQKTLGKEKRK